MLTMGVCINAWLVLDPDAMYNVLCILLSLILGRPSTNCSELIIDRTNWDGVFNEVIATGFQV